MTAPDLKEAVARDDFVAEKLACLRAEGWRVAVHNDYRLNGEDRTFWLLTHSDGRWTKGESTTDLSALHLASINRPPANAIAPTGPVGQRIAELEWELAEARAMHRWNIEERDAELLVCRGHHEKSAGCEYVRYVPAESAESRTAALEAESAGLRTALILLLPFVDFAGGEGLVFTPGGDKPEMDAGDICSAVAKALGMELGDESYMKLVDAGCRAISAALIAREAGYGE